jgi:hypothetical protein
MCAFTLFITRRCGEGGAFLPILLPFLAGTCAAATLLPAGQAAARDYSLGRGRPTHAPVHNKARHGLFWCLCSLGGILSRLFYCVLFCTLNFALFPSRFRAPVCRFFALIVLRSFFALAPSRSCVDIHILSCSACPILDVYICIY